MTTLTLLSSLHFCSQRSWRAGAVLLFDQLQACGCSLLALPLLLFALIVGSPKAPTLTFPFHAPSLPPRFYPFFRVNYYHQAHPAWDFPGTLMPHLQLHPTTWVGSFSHSLVLPQNRASSLKLAVILNPATIPHPHLPAYFINSFPACSLLLWSPN